MRIVQQGTGSVPVWIIVLLSISDAGGQGQINGPSTKTDVEAVRGWLGNIDAEAFDEALRALRKIGEKRVFPAFHVILTAPQSSREIREVFSLLRHWKADRRQFVDSVLRALGHNEYGVRISAVLLLTDIGSSEDASLVVALLSDTDVAVAQLAASALVKIGSNREVTAMDIWLQGVARRDHAALRRHVKDCRDALQKRLDEERKEKHEVKRDSGH